MTVMTFNNQPNVVIGPTQLYIVAMIVVLAMAAALTLLFALPTVESWRFGDYQILNDFVNLA